VIYYGEIAVSMAAIIVTAIVYMRRAGSKRVQLPWYRNPVGQFVVVLCTFSLFIFVRSLLSHTHNMSNSNLIISGLFVMFFLYMAFLFAVFIKPREHVARPRKRGSDATSD
jgi:L-asparagine transporter-like permease